MRRSSSSAGRMANPSASAPSTGTTTPPTTNTNASAISAIPKPTVASVHFKARCETLGHGEDVYMVPLDDNDNDNDNEESISSKGNPPPSPAHRHKMIPLYTTAQSYPWYSTLSSLAMPVTTVAMNMNMNVNMTMNMTMDSVPGISNSPGRQLFNAYRNPAPEPKEFRYRYAVFRAGAFHRWESDEDENFCPTSNEEDPNTLVNTEVNAQGNTIKSDAMVLEDDNNNNDNNNNDINNNTKDYHVLPCRFLHPGETYIVNDVLGKRKGQKPDIYHKKTLHTGNHQYVGVEGSGTCPKIAIATQTPQQISNNKKSVGFAVPPPARKQAFGSLNQTIVSNNNSSNSNSSNNSNSNTTANTTNPTTARNSFGEAVQLNATDGLVVVSAFLPVVVHRDETSETPKWSADWDYEALLSMQTHLRVTRVGVVKWKGWHGNYNANSNNNNNNNTTSSSSSNSNNNSNTTDGTEEQQGQSEHYGVPIEERHLVEECLRPFNCVPVWIDPLVFGEM